MADRTEATPVCLIINRHCSTRTCPPSSFICPTTIDLKVLEPARHSCTDKKSRAVVENTKRCSHLDEAHGRPHLSQVPDLNYFNKILRTVAFVVP
ncbi:hypothetical protein Plhal304r1_c005g0020901 [Plasmopara halstedii]